MMTQEQANKQLSESNDKIDKIENKLCSNYVDMITKRGNDDESRTIR